MDRKKLTLKETETINYYSDHAQEWGINHQQVGNFGKLAPEYKLFFKELPSGTVIEIGTGTGEDAINLVKKYGASNYLGVEPAEGLRKIASENNPSAKFLEGSIYDLGDIQSIFDGFWLCQVLIHIPKNRIHEALESVRKVVKSQGIGMISILEGNSDMENSRPGRYYTLWSDKEFANVLAENKFEIINKRKLETGHSPWLIYIVRKIK